MQESFKSVGGELFETLEGCNKENYSNQVWNARRRWWWYWLFSNRGKGGYSEVDECDE